MRGKQHGEWQLPTPRGVSERIMVLRLSTSCGYVTLISAYAPTLTSLPEAKIEFYDQLDDTVRQVRPGDRLQILGDFNARVGQDNTAWPDCLGKHGVGKQNENGQLLLEFCSKYRLCVTNTYFKGSEMRKVSWKHPRSGHWHQLDLALTKKEHLKEVLHTRSFHSADCDTDHSLVACKVRLEPKKIHSRKVSGRKSIDVSKTRNNKAVESFSTMVNQITAAWDTDASVESEWEAIKVTLTKTAGEAFGYRRPNSSDWFNENIDELQPILDAKHLAASTTK
ncbi:hypothetical protein ABMA27_010536 [Loxostege sticticalis]|uniref:Craniofacial development protein 2-like n=1 Tax=Loxostege sticticalis TaxID=481309 RepID=A0ABR3H5Y7_LOXSC